MKHVIVVVVLLFGSELNAQAAGWYASVKSPGDNDLAAATVYCDQTYGAQKYATAAHRKCMLARGWRLTSPPAYCKVFPQKFECDPGT
jgi:hypothetical protein